MNNLKSTFLAFLFGVTGFTTVSISATETSKNIMVEVHKLSDSNAKVDLKLNDLAETFELPELQIGETQEIVTNSGSTISVSRTDSGITVLVNGEEVNLPGLGNEMSAHMIRAGTPIHSSHKDSVRVIGDLTDEQIAIIKDAFAAAGVEKEVVFNKGYQMHFVSVDGSESGDFQFSTSNDLNTWVTQDDKKIFIKKIDKGDGDIKVEKKIIIKKEAKEDN